MSEEPDTRRGGTRALLSALSIMLVAFVGSDALVSRSPAFWTFARRGASGPEDAALLLEADAAALRFDGPEQGLAALVTGSSLARSNFDLERLAERLGVPRDRVAKLWLPGMSGVELGMLAPRLAALRPERVYIPVSPWVLLPELNWERTRTYSPGVALALFAPGDLFEGRAEHLSRALRATHVIVRRRSPLRRVLLGRFRDVTAVPPRRIGGSQLQARAMHSASEEEYRCDSVHLRGLALLVERLREVGATVTLAPAPLRGRRAAASPLISARVDQCLAEEGLGEFSLRSASRPEFTEDDFDDSIHLGDEAAVRFTDWLTGGATDAL